MSELQDVSFAEDDDLPTVKRKLRIMQDEVLRLATIVSQQGAVDPATASFNLGAAGIYNSATPGLFAVPSNAAGFIAVTVNGQDARVAVFLP